MDDYSDYETMYHQTVAERVRLRQTNAELLAALQAVTILASSSMAGAKANLSKAGSIARAAIAKAGKPETTKEGE